jgi:hypothetical protein
MRSSEFLKLRVDKKQYYLECRVLLMFGNYLLSKSLQKTKKSLRKTNYAPLLLFRRRSDFLDGHQTVKITMPTTMFLRRNVVAWKFRAGGPECRPDPSMGCLQAAGLQKRPRR